MDNENNGKVKAAIIISAVLVVTLAFVLTLNAAFGWLSANGTVGGDNLKLKVDGDLFELALTSTDVPDTETNTDIISYLEERDYAVSEITSQNVPNIIGSMVDEAPKSGDDVKLCPGSFGYIKFYIKPKMSGDLTFRFTIRPEGVLKAGSEASAEEINETLSGHILYFVGRTGTKSNYKYSGLINSVGYFEHDITGAVAEELYEVTVYWIWPTTFVQMAFDESSGLVQNGAVFATGSSELDDMNEFISDNADMFFRDAGGLKSTAYYTDLMDDAAGHYVLLSEGYNHADQFIGDNTKWVVTVIEGQYVGSAP